MVGVGDVLAGKYRVEQVLGKGGMGYVVSAIHTQLDQRVAVKFMVPELCEHPEAVARFLREARAAVRIRSEHVARVLDVGTLDDGTPYMVMEFLWGRDLATELEEVRQLPVAQAVDFVLQACEALAEAHAYGIVHRDLKPANLFLTRRADGSALIKVLDFGISKAISDQAATSAESLTASQSLIGSPHYMSPEQVRRPKTVDLRSDIWALGVILHELISGDRPFGGDTPMSVLAAVVSDPAPRLRDVRPELSAGGVESVILRCLEKDPAHRYANVAELALALGPYAPSSAQPLIARIQGITRAQVQSHSVPSGLPGSLGPITPSSTPTTPRSNPTGESGLATLPSPIPLTDPRKGRTATDWGRSGIDRSQRVNMKWIFGAFALLTAVGCVMYVIGKSRREPDTRVMPEAASAPDAAASTVVLPPWPSLAPTLVEPPPKEPGVPAGTASSVQGARPATPPVPHHRRTKPRASAAPSGSQRSEGVPSATSGATRPPDPLDERR